MVHEQQAAALESLAAALPPGRYATALTVTERDTPKLCVVNRELPTLAADVYAEAGWFWWPWAKRIGPVDDTAAAAEAINRVLACGPSAGEATLSRDEALAALRAQWPAWELWIVPLAAGGELWCGRRRDDHKRVLNGHSPAELAEYLAGAAGT